MSPPKGRSSGHPDEKGANLPRRGDRPARATGSRPYLSVIVPVHDAEEVLARTLAALMASDLPRERWELVVVDDASSDGSALIAARHAQTLVRLPGRPRGAAYARNRGVDLAGGSVLLFVDADVCVRPGTLSHVVEMFERDPDLAAMYGSYDATDHGLGLTADYRDLLRHLVHRRAAGQSDAFWAACGAVRRDAFEAVGRFDEWCFHHPQLEDAEFGGRLSEHGYRTVLDPTMTVAHLKRWRLSELLLRDAWDRGVLRSRIFGGSSLGSSPTVTLRFTRAPTEWVALVAVVSLALSGREGGSTPLVAALAALIVYVGAHRSLVAAIARERGVLFALGVLPLHLMREAVMGAGMLYGWLLRGTIGAPRPDPTTEAFAEVGLETWPPVPSRR